jgi:hypothetical protein
MPPTATSPTAAAWPASFLVPRDPRCRLNPDRVPGAKGPFPSGSAVLTGAGDEEEKLERALSRAGLRPRLRQGCACRRAE